MTRPVSTVTVMHLNLVLNGEISRSNGLIRLVGLVFWHSFFFFFFIAYVVVGVEPNPQTVALLD